MDLEVLILHLPNQNFQEFNFKLNSWIFQSFMAKHVSGVKLQNKVKEFMAKLPKFKNMCNNTYPVKSHKWGAGRI